MPLVHYPLPERDNRAMFDAIAPRYDRLNAVVSFRSDTRWRAATVRALAPRAGGTYVDVGTGTGDLARALHRAAPGATVLGLDPSMGMLGLARRKVPAAFLGQASGLRIPLRDHSADGVASAFVLRNLPDVGAYFAEAHRILRPRGILANLEIARAKGRAFGPLYRFYFYRIMPRIGRALSGNPSAYSYLADSVKVVPDPEVFAAKMAEAGFREIAVRRFWGGACALTTGRR